VDGFVLKTDITVLPSTIRQMLTGHAAGND
jgi:hypothetical protein